LGTTDTSGTAEARDVKLDTEVRRYVIRRLVIRRLDKPPLNRAWSGLHDDDPFSV